MGGWAGGWVGESKAENEGSFCEGKPQNAPQGLDV